MKKPKKLTTSELMFALTGIDIAACPKCESGRLRLLSIFEKKRKFIDTTVIQDKRKFSR